MVLRPLAPVREIFTITGTRCSNGEERYDGGPAARSDGTMAYLSLPHPIDDVWLADPVIHRADVIEVAPLDIGEPGTAEERICHALAILNHPSLSDHGADNSVAQRLAAQIRATLDPIAPAVRVTKRLTVQVSVEADDIRATITWDTNRRALDTSTLTGRWLMRYERLEAGSVERERLWSTMPTSVQWCVHTLEHEGIDALRKALEGERE